MEVQDGSLEKGRVVMLPWRVATKLQMSPERFEGLLAVAETKTPGLKSRPEVLYRKKPDIDLGQVVRGETPELRNWASEQLALYRP